MSMKIKKSPGEHIFDIANYILMLFVMLVVIYPLYYVLVASVSDPVKIYESGGMVLYPKGFSMSSYVEVLNTKSIWTGYRNTIFYVIATTCISVFLTITAAYALTRKDLPFRNAIMLLIVFTMYFGGGIISTYLVIRAIGVLDTPFAVILTSSLSTYNLMVTISYMRGLPYELEEAAEIDGASNFTVLFKVLIPLSMPIIAVITLYCMVGMWNNYFGPMIYLSDRKYFPLQLILREILIFNRTSDVAAVQSQDSQAFSENIKYAVIVVSTIPILCVYPFLQRFFVKGVMIGAVKA